MIIEIVKFPLPSGSGRDDALKLYRQTASKWASNPELMSKDYFLDESRGLGGGVYVWPSREAAERWHGEEYREMVRRLYGSFPDIEIFDVLIRVEPSTGVVSEI